MTGDAGDARVVLLSVVMALRTDLPPGHQPPVRFVAEGAVGMSVFVHDVQSFGRVTVTAIGHAGHLLRHLVAGAASLLGHRPFRVDLVALGTGCRRRITRFVAVGAGELAVLAREVQRMP